jgi:hypothetical protein
LFTGEKSRLYSKLWNWTNWSSSTQKVKGEMERKVI